MSGDPTSQRAEIMRLRYLEGLSIRAISKHLRVSRKTVRRNLGKLPLRSTGADGRRSSLLAPYEPQIQELLLATPELRATQVLERVRPCGYTGGISILRELVRKLRPTPASKVYLTVRHQPAATMQVDWGDFGYALPGIPRRVSVFAALLPYSAHLFLRFCLSQAMGSFLRCMDRALEFFGGATNADVFDNMKTVVLENRPGFTPRFNDRFLAYANARSGFAVIARTPGHPEPASDMGGRAYQRVRTDEDSGRAAQAE